MKSLQRILIVDDDAFIRRPLELILRQEGFEPEMAVDGNDCLAQVALRQPDLIILDVMMPGRDGMDVCKTLKNDPEYARIPIILLTAIGQERDRARGLAAGAEEFMTKPYSPSDLIKRVRELLTLS